MGRMLGAFDPDDELDRPDLNKCPDCGCYFASDECPLCGKTCPPEMRAGARVEQKKKKKKRHRPSGSTGRVTFIPWYHSWWFILIMTLWMPLVGIILFFTSPYPKKWKIILSVVAAAYMLLVYTGLGSLLIRQIFEEDPVNSKLSREAYMETCREVDAEAFYRSAGSEEGYYTMTLTVTRRVRQEYNDRAYYLCTGTDGDGRTVTIIIRDCLLADHVNFLPGDCITVWGEAAGEETVYNEDTYDSCTAPCLNMAYAEIKKQP